tara:strand:- start:9216 stop:9746 length:531 start_codon:yes stop_codon:yes gene_type:complete
MKDYAARLTNKKSKKRNRNRFKTKKSFTYPFNIKKVLVLAGGLIIFSMITMFILNTDLKKIIAIEVRPSVNYEFPVGLAEGGVYEEPIIDFDQDCSYLLQVEAYGKRIYAEEGLSNILGMGITGYIDTYYDPKDTNKVYYRLMSGPYLTKSDINNAKDVLVKSGGRPIIRKQCTIK